MPKRVKWIVLAAGIELSACPGVQAQEAAPAAAPPTRCTGVLCELYYANRPAGQPDPTALPCHDFVCGMFGGRTPDQPVPQPAVAASEPVAVPAEPPHKTKHKTHHSAKADKSKPAESGATPAGASKTSEAAVH